MPVLPFPKINNGVEPKPIETLTEVQLAESLMISIKTLQRWRLEGGGPPFIKISRRCVRYRIDDVHEWMNKKLRENTLEDGQ